MQLIALFGIPAAMAIAILKHRLYDIDVIISRAVVYGLLSAAATGVYAGIVLGIGTFVGHRSGPLLTIAAAVTIALLFQPLQAVSRRSVLPVQAIDATMAPTYRGACRLLADRIHDPGATADSTVSATFRNRRPALALRGRLPGGDQPAGCPQCPARLIVRSGRA